MTRTEWLFGIVDSFRACAEKMIRRVMKLPLFSILFPTLPGVPGPEKHSNCFPSMQWFSVIVEKVVKGWRLLKSKHIRESFRHNCYGSVEGLKFTTRMTVRGVSSQTCSKIKIRIKYFILDSSSSSFRFVHPSSTFPNRKSFSSTPNK